MLNTILLSDCFIFFFYSCESTYYSLKSQQIGIKAQSLVKFTRMNVEDMNVELTRVFTRDEVTTALQ